MTKVALQAMSKKFKVIEKDKAIRIGLVKNKLAITHDNRCATSI